MDVIYFSYFALEKCSYTRENTVSGKKVSFLAWQFRFRSTKGTEVHHETGHLFMTRKN
jgi:hypothetical protein